MNSFRLGLKYRMIVLFVLIAIIPIAIVGYLAFYSARNALMESDFSKLEAIASERKEMIENFFEELKDNIRISQDYFNIKKNLPVLARLGNKRDSSEYHAAKDMLDNQLRAWLRIKEGVVLDVMLVSQSGQILYSANPGHQMEDIGNPLPDPGNMSFQEGKKGIYITDIFRNRVEGERMSILVSAPVSGFDGSFIGVIVFEVSMQKIKDLLAESTGLGRTGEALIGKRIGNDVLFLTPLRYDPKAALTKKVVLGGREAVPMQEAVSGKKGAGISMDYRGEPIIAYWQNIPIMNWGMVVKIDMAEAFSSITTLRKLIFMITFFIIVIVGVSGYYMASRISDPVRDVAQKMDVVGKGDLTQEVPPSKRRDEIGVLQRSLRGLIEDSKRQIGEIMEGVNLLSSSATEIMASTSQFSQSAAQTASAVRETTTTTEELKQTAQLTGEKAGHVSESARKAIDMSSDGRKSVEEAVAGMEQVSLQVGSIAESIVELSEQSHAIGEIIAVVDDLAEQSNLLSVNAAIEAAKAGEAGKGFAVVAREIKSLAEQSKEATGRVRSILNDIQKATSGAVMATEQGSKAVERGLLQSREAGEAIALLKKNIDESAHAAIQIAASNKQQMVGIEQVALAMESIDEASKQNVDGARGLSTAAKALEDIGKRLKELTSRFRI